MKSFQEILLTLSLFWEKQGCIIHQGYDLEVGAGTFNPATFLRSLGPEPYRAAYIEPSRRPSDGRYGDNPIRFQHYFQYQVMLKPSPPNILDLYLQSLEAIGFDLSKHDIRFVHDDWESPTLGAAGLGWEVWMDGMEVTQFTYFQQVAGQELRPVTGEITYGIERLSTFLQNVDSTFDLTWSRDVTYGDIYKHNEFEWSHYNFDQANTAMWFAHFDDYEKEATSLANKNLPIPAYDFVMKASHAFNMLDARGAISVSERNGYIARIRNLSCLVATSYVESRKEQGYPLLNRFKETETPQLATKSAFKPSFAKEEDFLLEIGLEELPATFVSIGVTGLEKALGSFLTAEKIAYKKIHAYGTPRRLAVLIESVATEKPAQTIEKKGPAITAAFDAAGNPLPAAQGFFRSIQKDPLTLQEIKDGKIKELSIRPLKGAEYLYAEQTEPSVTTFELLQKHLPSLILGLDFPKKMRWGSQEIAFARPLRWLVALFGDTVLPFSIGDITSGQTSYGHRRLKNIPFEIIHPKDYLEATRSHFVMADIQEREANILRQLENLEKEMDGKVIARDKVIPQVLHLVEWPTLTYTDFDASYLKAPKEVLISEMVEHQKYFPVEDKDGNLKNLFVITSNNQPTDLIRKGNRKVLSSRLKDGTFLFEQDLKTPLATFVDKLKSITYLKGLGTIYDKTERLKKHANVLNSYLNIADHKKIERAAHLAKVDLGSHVIYEFPELQGVMGEIYALHAGEDKEVALSINEHWMPRGENAPLPESSTGVILSLADKIDNLISCFGMSFKPTSSSDPFALRRQVFGMIRILLKGHYRLPLQEVITACIAHFPALKTPSQEIATDISQFILNRIKSVFLDFALTKDEIEAAMSLGFNDIYDAFCRIQALSDFRKNSTDLPALLEVYKRAKGQIPANFQGTFSEKLIKDPSEIALFNALEQTSRNVSSSIQTHDYSKAFLHLAGLKEPLAGLFDAVKILDDDLEIRQNRLALLQNVFTEFSLLVDFSKLQKG